MNQPQDAAGAPGPAEGQGASAGQSWMPPPAAAPGYGAPPGAGYGTPAQPGYGKPHPAYNAKDPSLAEWWRRLFARVIDGLILAVIFSPFWIPPWRTFIEALRNVVNRYPAGAQLNNIPAARNAIAHAESHLIRGLFVVGLVFYLAAFIYDWIQHGLWSQTIGKRALGTQVVTANGYAKVGPGAAGGRAAIYALTPLVPFVGWIFDLLNELWLTWDTRRQCLHDKAAHTVVVKKEYLSSHPQAGGW